MRKPWFIALGFYLMLASIALAQQRPYIGYVYPAGGQQGTTFHIRLGGLRTEDVQSVIITGPGVTVKIVENLRRLNNQEQQLLTEQLKQLRQATNAAKSNTIPDMMAESMMMMSSPTGKAATVLTPADRELMARLEKRTREFVANPASDSIADLVIIEVAIAKDAPPGEREIRLVTLRGISNPLPFHVGQMPEYTRQPMLTATKQTLGKEAAALRKRPLSDAEARVNIPCTMNGQIGSGEVNRYRFTARKGQRLVINTMGRQLIPFIADAVPGWFQPVLELYDASGKEVAYEDDYRFKPDPTLFYEVPKDGEYVVAIHDSIYRGREDFIYRISIGELPFVTSIFPLGGRVGKSVTPTMAGWNLDQAELGRPEKDAAGVYSLAARRKGIVSNRVPFELDNLPEAIEQEPNDDTGHAQKVTLPIIMNGRINKPDDWDVYAFEGKANDTVVAEVRARRLDSPLDSIIKLTDAKGTVLAFNDDYEDLGAGANTHHADSYLAAKLPASGLYCLHVGDTMRNGGEAYAYRLRLSAPQPDFAIRTVPSSMAIRGKTTAAFIAYALRKDGFAGPIKISLNNPPAGLTAAPVTIYPTTSVARLTVKSSVLSFPEPVSISLIGTAKVDGKEVTREAVPAEDRMQAFLWRHLVPAQELPGIVLELEYNPTPKRKAPPLPSSLTNVTAEVKTTNKVAAATNLAATMTNTPTGTNTAPAKPKFTRAQITNRLKELKLLFEEGYLTESFYNEKVTECETSL
jgi:hypothetical protein